jgi:hypothetical protein
MCESEVGRRRKGWSGVGSRVEGGLRCGWVNMAEFEVGDGSRPFLVQEPQRHLGNTHHFHAAMVREGSRLMKQEGEWGIEGEEQKKFREGDE